MPARIFTKLPEASGKPDIVRRRWIMTMRRSTKLPDFAIFPNLEELSIDARGSGLTMFPRITGCTKLRSFTFTSSEITKAPANLGDLVKLQTLVLVGHRRLTKLPDEVTTLAKLRESHRQ